MYLANNPNELGSKFPVEFSDEITAQLTLGFAAWRDSKQRTQSSHAWTPNPQKLWEEASGLGVWAAFTWLDIGPIDDEVAMTRLERYKAGPQREFWSPDISVSPGVFLGDKYSLHEE